MKALNNNKKLDLIADIKSAFSKYESCLISLDQGIEVDKGYGIEGSCNEIVIEFDFQGRLHTVTGFYMHFISEIDNLEIDLTDNFEEIEAIVLCFKNDDSLRDKISTKHSESTIKEVFEQWESLPHDYMLVEGSRKTNLSNKSECFCKLNDLLRVGCLCGASHADRLKARIFSNS